MTTLETTRKVLEGGGHVVTSPFGTRTLNGTTRQHNGIDMVGRGYTLDHVVAYDDGTVIAALNTCSGATPATGNYVKLKHNSGLVSIYMHLARGSVTVKVGDKVKRGQRIGYMGNTGRSTGAHLHFGLQVGGTYVDPIPYLRGGEIVSVSLDTLRQGSKGAQVKTLQRLLKAMGYEGQGGRILAIDGAMGKHTTHAVKAYQRSQKLAVDGVVGAKTWRALLGA